MYARAHWLPYGSGGRRVTAPGLRSGLRPDERNARIFGLPRLRSIVSPAEGYCQSQAVLPVIKAASPPTLEKGAVFAKIRYGLWTSGFPAAGSILTTPPEPPTLRPFARTRPLANDLRRLSDTATTPKGSRREYATRSTFADKPTPSRPLDRTGVLWLTASSF